MKRLVLTFLCLLPSLSFAADMGAPVVVAPPPPSPYPAVAFDRIVGTVVDADCDPTIGEAYVKMRVPNRWDEFEIALPPTACNQVKDTLFVSKSGSRCEGRARLDAATQPGADIPRLIQILALSPLPPGGMCL